MIENYTPSLKTWLLTLCASAVIALPVGAEEFTALPDLSPNQIAADMSYSYDADTGVSTVTAPSFDPFENDSTLAGKASLRSGGGATTFEGDYVTGGAFLDMSMIYTNGSNDPFDVRGFERYVYVSGQPVDQILHDTKTLDCSENVREVVYDDGYHRGASAGLLAGLYFAFPRYRGHRHYWESGYYRGYRSAWRDWRRRRPYIQPRHPRGPRHAGRIGGRHDSNLHGDRNGPRRTGDRNGPRRMGDRNGLDRNRNDHRGDDRRNNDQGAAVRPDRRNGVGAERDAALDRGNRRHPPSGRSLVMGTSERIPAINRENRERREAQPIVHKDKNSSRDVRSYREGKHPERMRNRSRQQPRVVREAPSRPIKSSPAPIKSAPNTERMVSRPIKQAEPRRVKQPKVKQPRVQQPKKHKERRVERPRSERKSNVGRSTDRHFKSKRPSRKSNKRLNFFPIQGSGYLSYPHSSRREVHVSYRCVREEMTTLHIPQERLDAARFDGLTIVVVDNQDRDIPVYIPPNYIEGFRQAVQKGSGYSSHSGNMPAPTIGYPQP
ncbi:MAG: hypothetical protein ACPGVT_00055 [Maricaulaceae bacterium]